jgi:hypothetical protein
MRFISSLFVFLSAAAYASPYDTRVLSDHPMMYLTMGSQQAVEPDLSGHGHRGTYFPQTSHAKRTTMPNGDAASAFDGFTQYLEVPSAASLSVKPTGAITIEAWMRPDTLQFPTQEKNSYVHWAGKGESGQQEYVLRMYSKTNPAGRPNRISGYAFNPDGQQGSGSYFEDVVKAGVWIHYALVIDARNGGTVSIFKNGVLRKTTPFSQFNVHPQPGNAPLRIATRDFASFFKGAIGKFAIYARALSETTLKAHVAKMR